MRWPGTYAAAAVALLAVGAAAGHARSAGQAVCAPRTATAAYTSSVQRAVASGRDLWGGELLRARGGPTYAAARRFLDSAHAGNAVAGAAADRERLVLRPAVLPVHLVRVDRLRAARRGRERDRHPARRRPVALRLRRLRQRALRVLHGAPAAGAAGGGLPADPADVVHRRERASATGRSRSSAVPTVRTARAR